MSEKTIRVLIIEDNYGDVLLIKEMLAEIREKKFELEWKDEMKSGLEYLKSNSVDIVLLDLSLPDSSGIETFSKFHIAYPEVPVILLTGLADEELATTMVQAGAQDYLVKGAIDSTLISRAILYAIERSAFLKFSTLELKRRKIMEETLTRVNRALQMLSECNQVVVRSHTEDELYNNVCEILIKAGGFYCAWILLSDEIEENFNVRYYSGNSDILKYINEKNSEFKRFYKNIERKRYINNRMPETDGNTDNSEIFDELSSGAGVVIPIIYNVDVLGYVSILSETQDVFDDGEIVLLNEFTNDFAYGINSIRLSNEKEKTLKALEKSEQRYRFIVDKTNNVIYQLRYDTMKYSYMDPEIEQLTGYTVDEINQMGFQTIIADVSNLKLNGKQIEYCEKPYNEPGEKEGDYLIRTKEGSFKWLSDRSYPWYDKSGNLLGAIGIMSNITERKQSEQELIRAKEQAEEMNRLKTNFLSNMSHELRTPMVGILGYSEIMMTQSEELEARKMAGAIHVSGTRLMDTLNLILDLSRLEAGKLELKLAEVELISLVKECAMAYDGVALKKNLSINIYTQLASLRFNSDLRLLRNSVNNVINNAVKFCDTGGVSIYIDVSLENEQKFVIVKIIDTGIGISKEDQKIMWDEFRQVSEGMNRRYEGTGLGLTITKKFVEKLGGVIDVQSELNKGSVFTLKFKVEDYFVEFMETKNTALPSDQGSLQLLRKVLVVDDDETSRNLIGRFLNGKYVVVTASNGKDAVYMANNDQFDAILMDINLGKGINGLEATKLIRKLAGYKEIPIIAVTAYAMKGDKEEFLSCGCSGYISKPFSKEQFLSLIGEVM